MIFWKNKNFFTRFLSEPLLFFEIFFSEQTYFTENQQAKETKWVQFQWQNLAGLILENKGMHVVQPKKGKKVQ